jgi:hypothetical protein
MIAVAEIKHPDIPKYQFLNVVNFKKDGLLENTFCSPVIATNDTVFNIGVVSMLCVRNKFIFAAKINDDINVSKIDLYRLARPVCVPII